MSDGELIAHAVDLLKPCRTVAGPLVGDVREIIALRRDESGRLHALPPWGRCHEFIGQFDPGNLETQVVLGEGHRRQPRGRLPEHDWPEPLGDSV